MHHNSAALAMVSTGLGDQMKDSMHHQQYALIIRKAGDLRSTEKAPCVLRYIASKPSAKRISANSMMPRVVTPPSSASTGGTSGTKASTMSDMATISRQPPEGANRSIYAPGADRSGPVWISLDSCISVLATQLTARHDLGVPVAHNLRVRIPTHSLGVGSRRLTHRFAQCR